VRVHQDSGGQGEGITALEEFRQYAHLRSYAVSPLVASYNGISGFVKVTALFVENNHGGGPPCLNKTGAGSHLNGKDEAQIPVGRRKRGFSSVLGKGLERLSIIQF